MSSATIFKAPYLDEKRDIERLQETRSGILEVFDRFFLKDEMVWPYEVVDGEEAASPRTFSFSTNAMIVFALAAATGRISRSQLIPTLQHATVAMPAKLVDSLEKTLKNAIARFPSEIDGARKKRVELKIWKDAQKERGRAKKDVQLVSTSASFGPNDPLTLTWLLEVLGKDTPADPQVRERLRRDLIPAAQEIVTSTFEEPSRSPLRLPFDELVPHAFVLLRVLHLFNTSELQASAWPHPPRARDLIQDYLLNRAHFHLSSISVQDGGFDAGEIVFSLEGLLLCDPSLPDYSLFDRAFEVLAERQRETPYWRPLRPFRVTSRGMVLLPQSVEIANSLLRICSRLDEGRDRSYFSDYVDLFKAYTRWLESRTFVGKTKDHREIFGWQSEHTFAPNRIHLWQTSQVLLYLMHYAAMLQGHIARRSFKAARLSAAPTSSLGKPDAASWNRWEKSEPMGSLSGKGQYAIYRIIRDRIIRPRESGSRPDPDWSSSALLYGPPGTGKSRIAREIALALGYRFVTITPSDFITAGQEAVEARAKNIFSTLMQQTDLVVLFDEVDQLLLDRGSELYRIQGDIFKLITPGMLTKLNDLTGRKEVVFVVATNYFERIDPAIKRSGRISLRLLVLPPDAGQRMRFITEGADFKGPLFPGWDTVSQKGKNAVVDQTALFTYGELQDLAKGLGESAAKGDGLKNEILDRCSEFSSTISVASYKNRVIELPNEWEVIEGGPLEEFVMVTYIAAESNQVSESDRSWIEAPLHVAWDKEAVSKRQSHVWDVLKNAGVVSLEAGS